MSRAEELLDSLTDEQIMMYGVNPVDEPHIVIESDKSITVPDDLRHIAVQGEHNIETVTFDCPRYWDGHDLSRMQMRIVYQRPDGHREPHLVENLRVDDIDENTIHFEWTISGNVTAVKGNISFMVCAKLSDSEGNREREWHTRLNQDLVVDEGMECSGEEIVEQNPDIIEAILAQLDDLKNSGGVSDEQIAHAVEEYFEEHPIESGVSEQEVRAIIAAYLTDNPPEGGTITDEQLADAIEAYFEKNPIEIPDSSQSQTTETKETIVSVAVASESVILDSTASEQTVNLAWTVENARTVPAFTNYYVPNDSHPMPKEFATTGYTSLFGGIYGKQSAFVQGHQYFQAMHYSMDGDSTAELHSVTAYPAAKMSGTGWIYALATPPGVSAANFAIKNTGTGTGVIDYLYCIDITAMQEAGLVAEDITLAELAELFGELPLVPGQDYPGGTIGTGTATLSIDRGGQISTVDNSNATATVKGGDTLSVEGGSVTFMLKVLKTVSSSETGAWEGVKWVAFGDSLTDGSINADTKYHKLIAESTGIKVVDMGVGGTGYWRGHEDGNAFYQRMSTIPANADVVTVFGSINDWRITLEDVEIGTASDTIEAGTLAGYINECVNVIQDKAPYAQVALITAMPYHGIREDIQESLANIIVAVARYRKIKYLDLYHESGFRVDDPVFAQVYCTDYSETADTYGHPSNLAHERIIAPEFMQLLRRMIL